MSSTEQSMHPKTMTDILDFVHVIGSSSDDVARILRLHGMCEFFLERIIASRMPGGSSLVDDERFSFYHKLQIVGALGGLDSGTIGALRKLSKLRNRCAHEKRPQVASAELVEIGTITGPHFGVALADFEGEHREFCALAWAIFKNLSAQVTAPEIAAEKLRIPT